ncbi:MAG: hypothetical protein KatS3mg129_2921 [Leptospiraceae bacterium]|nr:MAG: hypothetical protein KatS3mg129_2921 [Leptospiraceae bacterium]
MCKIMVFNNLKTKNQNYSTLLFYPAKNYDFPLSKYWLTLAILSISLSGFFAFFITIARTPHIYELLNDPDFFKKALAIHVNLGFLMWLSCFIVSVFYLISPINQKKTLPFYISISGIILVSIPSLFLEGKAILSNYIPMIDHPVFFIGIFLFTAGIFLALFDKNLLLNYNQNTILPPNAITWIKASAISFIIAFESGLFSYLWTPKSFEIKNYYEILFWASGHIFVFAIEALKISLWFTILYILFPENKFFKNNKYIKLLGILYTILPLFSLFIFRFDTFSNEFREFYTQIMRWGIFPFTSLILIGIIFQLFKYQIVYNFKFDSMIHKSFLWSIYLSMFMTILGYVLGAMIRIPNTMVPGHYHASIGAITLILMTFSIILLDYFKFPIKSLMEKYKIFSYQPIIYAIGQSIFAIGFGLAGINGQGRKLFAKDQEIRGILDYLGLGFVGLGGIIAIFAGILFVSIAIYCLKYSLSKKTNVLIIKFTNSIKEVPYGK